MSVVINQHSRSTQNNFPKNQYRRKTQVDLSSSAQSPHWGQSIWVWSYYLSFFNLNRKHLSDNLSHLGKWVKFVKFETDYEFFCTWKVAKQQNSTSSLKILQPRFTMCVSLNMYQFKTFESVSLGLRYYPEKLDLTQFLLLLKTYHQNVTYSGKSRLQLQNCASPQKDVSLIALLANPIQLVSNMLAITISSHMLKYIWDNVVLLIVLLFVQKRGRWNI